MINFKRKLNTWGRVGLLLDECTIPASLINNIARVYSDAPTIFDALSKGQLISKLWLAHTLRDELDFDFSIMRFLICGGWYGTLGPILHHVVDGECTIRSVDINPDCAAIANSVNSEAYLQKLYEAVTEDMFNTDYRRHDVIINTSTEHIRNYSDWFSKIPDGKYVVLQGNDFTDCPEHVNCVGGPIDLLAGQQVKEIHYAGTLSLPDYNRFMVICTK